MNEDRRRTYRGKQTTKARREEERKNKTEQNVSGRITDGIKCPMNKKAPEKEKRKKRKKRKKKKKQ